MDFEQALNELINAEDLSFPALNPALGGASTAIKVKNNTVYFDRNTSTESVTIDELRLAYQILRGECNDKKSLEWYKKFKTHCKYTFLLQFLVYFDLADVSGKGKNGNPFVVKFK